MGRAPRMLNPDLPDRLAGRFPPAVTEALVGILFPMAAVALRDALMSLTGPVAPFPLNFVAVLCATLLAGWRSGVLAVCVAQLLAWYILVEPKGSFALARSSDITALLLVAVSSLLIVTIIAFYQREVRRSAAQIARQLEAREILVAELNHRVKNTLAIVQSLSHQSFKHQSSGDERRTFERRLAALAGAHNILTEHDWKGAHLHDVVCEALKPFSIERFVLRGPDLLLSPGTAVAFCLAFHELATNSLKHGTLTVPDGRVELTWRDDRDDGFWLSWRERNGPAVSKPDRVGSGLKLIQRIFQQEVKGVVQLHFADEGFQCVVIGSPGSQPYVAPSSEVANPALNLLVECS